MTDRELLEFAAKAAGLGLFVWGKKGEENFTLKRPDGGPGARWNPLTDDGDALRLAVKLRISLIHEQEYMGGPVLETLEATSPPESGSGRRTVSTECLNEIGVDEFSATRRAIVRAAAEIGKAMP